MFEPFEGPLWMAVIVTTVVMFALLWLFDGAKVRADSTESQEELL